MLEEWATRKDMKRQHANGGRKAGKEVGLLHWEEGKAVTRWREGLPGPWFPGSIGLTRVQSSLIWI